jgi:hemerythrin-like domain-containing protein
MQATAVLRTEHEVIQQVLDCVEELADRATQTGLIDLVSAREALDFLGAFADRCHHAKEEQCLFPALHLKGLPKHVGPVAVMLDEHDQGRAAIQWMRRAVADAERDPEAAAQRFAKSARAYVELLRDHIDKENGVLFPMADQMLDEAETRALLASFDEVEHHDLGDGTHERYLALAQGLCERLHIAWVPHATAAHSCCGQHGACH